MNLPPLSLQFIQGLLSHVASLPLVHTEESRTELEGLISKAQLCPFLSLEMRKIIPGPPRGICFCSDSMQIPDYLTPLGDSRLKSNQYRAILSEHSRRLRRIQGGLHQNVTSADTRETGLQRSRETWAEPPVQYPVCQTEMLKDLDPIIWGWIHSIRQLKQLRSAPGTLLRAMLKQWPRGQLKFAFSCVRPAGVAEHKAALGRANTA